MRLIAKNYCVTRPNQAYALYKMSEHLPSKKDWLNINLMLTFNDNLLFTSIIRMNSDGLGDLENLNVKIVHINFYALFTHLLVDVGPRKFFSEFIQNKLTF